MADRFGQFGRELPQQQVFRAGARLRLSIGQRQLFHNVRADAVVAAQRVAVTDHQDHRLTSSTISPPGASSWIWSGICPMAWVEQLRHGSKARMTASTRLSIPSVIS